MPSRSITAESNANGASHIHLEYILPRVYLSAAIHDPATAKIKQVLIQ